MKPIRRSSLGKILLVATVSASIAFTIYNLAGLRNYVKNEEGQLGEEMETSDGFLNTLGTQLGLLQKIADKGNLQTKYEEAEKINNEAVGWIFVENTNIDYPIMHGSNNYYLNRSWDRKKSKSGSIFLDESVPGFVNVTLLHGHNMLNGTMFSQLLKFRDKKFYAQNPHIYLYDGTKERKYQIISVFGTDPSINLKLNIDNKAVLEAYATELASKSMYKQKEVTDKPVLILNTCYSDGTKKHLLVVAQEV